MQGAHAGIREYGLGAGVARLDRSNLGDLVADGFDTAQIAAKLSYSQRTVKNVLHDVTSRLHLNNRSHAVAYALRQGLI